MVDEQHEGDKILHQDAVEEVVEAVLAEQSGASGVLFGALLIGNDPDDPASSVPFPLETAPLKPCSLVTGMLKLTAGQHIGPAEFYFPPFSVGSITIVYAEMSVWSMNGADKLRRGTAFPLGLVLDVESFGSGGSIGFGQEGYGTPYMSGALVGSDLTEVDGTFASAAGGTFMAKIHMQFTTSGLAPA